MLGHIWPSVELLGKLPARFYIVTGLKYLLEGNKYRIIDICKS